MLQLLLMNTHEHTLAGELLLVSHERLRRTSKMRILFESDSLALASPSLVALTNLLCLSDDTAGWKAYIQSWLESINQTDGLLSKMFSTSENGLMASALNVVGSECELVATLTALGLVQSVCRLLTGILNSMNQGDGAADVRVAEAAADKSKDVSAYCAYVCMYV